MTMHVIGYLYIFIIDFIAYLTEDVGTYVNNSLLMETAMEHEHMELSRVRFVYILSLRACSLRISF